MSEVKHIFIREGIDPETVQTMPRFLRKVLESIARGDATVETLEPSSTNVINFSLTGIASHLNVVVNEAGDDARISIGSGSEIINLLTVLDEGGLQYQRVPGSTVIVMSENLYFTFMEDLRGEMTVRSVIFIDEEDGDIARAFARIAITLNMN